MADVFLYRHQRTEEVIGVVATSARGSVSLQAVSRDTVQLDLTMQGQTACRRRLSRRGADLIRVIAALAGG